MTIPLSGPELDAAIAEVLALDAKRKELPKRPTIAELEILLASEDKAPVQINPDGSIHAGEDVQTRMADIIRALVAEREGKSVVPGAMRCAKCKFVLQRVNIYVRTGTVGAGSNEPEKCPNGCGPLWPLTYKDDADEAYKRVEEAMDREKTLSAENAELRKDAERYRFLRLHSGSGDVSCPPVCVPDKDYGYRSTFGGALDAVLDAAIQAARGAP